MNKSVATVLGIIAAIVIIILIWWGVSSNNGVNTPNPNGTSTTTVPAQTNTNNNEPPVVTPTPSKPTVITGQEFAASDTTVVLTGNVTPNGSQTSYWYDYGTTESMGKKTNTQMIGSGYRSIPTPAYITGLSANTTYYFRLSAQNGYGRVTGDTYTFRTTQGNPPPVGSIPTAKTLGATNVTQTGATLNGEVTPNKVNTWYWFEYGKTANLGSSTALATVGNGTTKSSVSLNLSDLDQNTTYYFRVNAQNQFGTVNGATLNFKTEGPAAPTAPKVTTKNATAVTSNSATLNGSVTANGADTKYWFEYSTDSLLGAVLLQTTDAQSIGTSSNPQTISADLTGLNSNTKYYFRLVAENNAGTTRGERLSFSTK